MGKVHGKGGSAQLDGNSVAEVALWRGDLTIGLVEATALQDSFLEKVAGPVGMTGTVECIWDSANTLGQVAMLTAVLTPVTVNLYLYEDATHYFSMAAFLEAGALVSITDAVKRTYNFTSHGTVEYT